MKATRDEMGKVYETFNNFFEMPVIKDDTADDTMDAKIREAAAGLTDQDVMDDDVQGILVKMGIKFPGQTVLDAPVEEMAPEVPEAEKAEAAPPAKPEWAAIVAAAKDLNECADLGLDPKIQTVGKKKDAVIAAVIKAGSLVQPTDKVSADTRKVLMALGVQVPEAAPAKKRGRKAGAVKKETVPKAKGVSGRKPKEGGSKGQMAKDLISKGTMTKKEIVDAIQERFGGSRAATMSIISHGKSEKYTTLGAVVVESEKGVLSFGK